MKKTVLLLVCLAMLGFGAFFYYMNIGDKVVDPSLKATLDMPGVKRGVKDNLGQLGIESADDVKYQVKGNKINFIYGNQRFYIKKDTIEDPEMQKAIKQLKLKIEANEDGSYIIKYKGKEIQEWVD